ncbi:hypothetical protein [Oceanobacillus sp. HCA-5259]|uniref:hypothetical protein n=1 Tax=Oceanobacillus sp. HCA-5259 TaxID=3134661 RepID=UPI003035E2F7
MITNNNQNKQLPNEVKSTFKEWKVLNSYVIPVYGVFPDFSFCFNRAGIFAKEKKTRNSDRRVI